MKTDRLVPFAGIVGLAVLALVVNLLAGRHFSRWDFTREKRFALSPATVETLHSLPGPIEVWVLLPAGDPLRMGMRQLLVSYATETTRLDVHYVDPDRDPSGYSDIANRFGIARGKTEGDRRTEEAVVVVATPPGPNERRWLITPDDLVQVVSAEDARVKPRSERALTGAIRNVIAGDKSTLCFTAGQGELSIDEAGGEGVMFLRDILVKDNFDVRSVDLSAPGDGASLKGCDVAIVAGPRAAFTPAAAERLRSYLLAGGNALLGVSPLNADTDTGLAPMGLDRVLSPFGIALEDALVIETDGERVFPDSRGIRFLADPKPHATTAGLVSAGSTRRPPQVIVHFTRALRTTAEEGAPAPTALLATSPGAYGVTNVKGAANWSDVPPKRASDLAGPMTIAYASERAKVGADAAHGPRVVVVGTGSAFIETNWQLPGEARGMVLLVESAIGWLSAKPQVLDVPERAESTAGIRITEESRNEIFRYVLLYMPLAAAALGLAVFFRRRSTEGAPLAPREDEPKPRAARGEKKPKKKKA